MEREEVDWAHRSLLCLRAVPCQEEASVSIKLRILLDYFFLFLFVIVGDLWDLLWIYTKFFEIKLG